MSPHGIRSNPPVKAEPVAVRPVSPPADDDPVAEFARLVGATAARDYRTATAARKALRQLGWSVAPLAKGGTIG